MPGTVSAYVGAAVTVIWFLGILAFIFNRKYAKTKIVAATVVNKQISEGISKYSGKSKRCYVTFQFEGKRKSFAVSEFSYNGYHKGETGTLKFKGDRLIDFS